MLVLLLAIITFDCFMSSNLNSNQSHAFLVRVVNGLWTTRHFNQNVTLERSERRATVIWGFTVSWSTQTS